MRKTSVLIIVLGMAFVAGGCQDPNYKPNPSVEDCNIGGPMGKAERSAATSPNPPAVQGRPPDCRMGPDGVMRRALP